MTDDYKAGFGGRMSNVPMTPEGFQRLKDELDRMIKVERPRNIKDIAEARSHGDLSENAEYHAAKERQSFIEGKIQEIQGKIAAAKVIDTSGLDHDKVAFGATVNVLDIESDEEYVFTLVGADEADIKHGKLSISSPMARALLGKEVGDTATVKAPARTIEYEIISIEFK